MDLSKALHIPWVSQCQNDMAYMSLCHSKKFDILMLTVSFLSVFNKITLSNLLFFYFFSMHTVTEYFKGHNWKVHPDFVYCEYNSLKDMDKELESSGESYFRDREDSFDTPEEQVMHFMSRAGRPGWKWMSVS